MAESYQITTRGLMEGFSKDQVVEKLGELFKRSKNEIYTMLKSEGFVVKKGMDLPDAIKYKVALEKRGCKCSIDPFLKPEPEPSQFPETVRNELYMSPVTEPFIKDEAAFELALLEIEHPPEEPPEPEKPVVAKVVEIKEPVPIKSLSTNNEVGSTVDGDPFFVQTPEDLCCNCGTKSDLSMIETEFVKHLVFSTTFEKEHSILIDLPYCPVCADSVGVYPMSPGLKWLLAICVWFGTFWPLAMHSDPSKYAVVRILLLVLSFIPAVIVFRWIGKPKSPMTSKYTPVIIREYSRNPNSTRHEGRGLIFVSMIAQLLGWFYKKVSAHDPDRIKVLTVKFSNPDYARAFKKVNKSFIQSGYIRVP